VIDAEPSGHVASTPAQRIEKVIHLPIAELEKMPAPYNPRDIDEGELIHLRESITYFGSVIPMLVNRRTDHIVDGHQRLKAARAEGLASFPIVEIDVDLVTEMELNAALNRIRGHWVDGDLSAMLREIEESEGNLARTGFSDEELEKYLGFAVESTGAPDAIGGGTGEFQEVSFVLSASQVGIVKRAIDQEIEGGAAPSLGNENARGCALFSLAKKALGE
jgi:ParB-like chromosome segregation protein Spo0J